MKKLSVSVLFLGLLMCAPAFSAADLPSNVQDACKNDIATYCKNVNPGQGRIGACLKSNSDKLSSDCHDQWQAARAQMKSQWQAKAAGFKSACDSDVQKFCGSQSGMAAIHSCLDEHSSDLSKACTDFRATNMYGNTKSTS
jgi:Golgi apparatus protein 1